MLRNALLRVLKPRGARSDRSLTALDPTFISAVHERLDSFEQRFFVVQSRRVSSLSGSDLWFNFFLRFLPSERLRATVVAVIILTAL